MIMFIIVINRIVRLNISANLDAVLHDCTEFSPISAEKRMLLILLRQVHLDDQPVVAYILSRASFRTLELASTGGERVLHQIFSSWAQHVIKNWTQSDQVL